MLKSIVIEIENNSNWQAKIFKTVSELVCEKIYLSFRDIFNCETRVAIEYVFDKNNNGTFTKFVKMSGRRSHSRLVVKRAIPLEKRKKYFSYKIFINNNKGINILNEEQIHKEDIWYTNPQNSTDVKSYIGIAVSVYDNSNVKYILEIDFINEFDFGDNNSENAIKIFIDEYLMSYINILSISYLLNLNKKGEIPEV